MPVVAVTGVTLGDGAVKAEDCPALVTVLQKPADPDAILAGIREAAITGMERRLRAAAARAKRYAEEDQPPHATPRGVSVPMPRRCCSVPWPAAAIPSR